MLANAKSDITVIEYAENKDESKVNNTQCLEIILEKQYLTHQKLQESNNQLMEGLTLGGDVGRGSKSKDHVKRRQLQAKMVMELMEVDKEQAKETLRLWKEMSEVFVQIRDMKFTTLDPYLKVRVVDAGCPYVNSLRSKQHDY